MSGQAGKSGEGAGGEEKGRGQEGQSKRPAHPLWEERERERESKEQLAYQCLTGE